MIKTELCLSITDQVNGRGTAAKVCQVLTHTKSGERVGEAMPLPCQSCADVSLTVAMALSRQSCADESDDSQGFARKADVSGGS